MTGPGLDALPAPPEGRTGWPWDAVPPSSPSLEDGEAWPRITIVTPSYNQAEWVEATLRSVLLQGYPNLEYIVMDGASTDGSVDIIRRYDRWLDGWVSEPDDGQPDAINRGFARATGRVLGWLNSDDLLLPGALERVGRLVRQRPEAVAWIGGCYRIDTDRRVTGTIRPRGLNREDLAYWGHRGFFYQPSAFFDATAFDEVGGLDTRLEYGFDVDLWLKLIERGAFVDTPAVLSAALYHPAAKSVAGRLGQHADTIALQVYHGRRDAAMDRLARLIERRRLRELLWLWVRSALGRAIGRLTFRRPAPLPDLDEALESESGADPSAEAAARP